MTEPQSVFVSYTLSDSSIATLMGSFLTKSGFKVWTGLPEPVVGDWNVDRELREIALTADVCVAILTRDYFRSEWCTLELRLLRAYGRRVIGFLAEPIGDAFRELTDDVVAQDVYGLLEKLRHSSTFESPAVEEVAGAGPFVVADIRDHEEGAPLMAGRTYVLVGGIAMQSPDQGVRSPTEERVEVDMVVYAPSMTIEPKHVGHATYARGEEAGLCEFLVMPTKTGNQQIVIEYYYLRQWLAALNFSVFVNPGQL